MSAEPKRANRKTQAGSTIDWANLEKDLASLRTGTAIFAPETPVGVDSAFWRCCRWAGESLAAHGVLPVDELPWTILWLDDGRGDIQERPLWVEFIQWVAAPARLAGAYLKDNAAGERSWMVVGNRRQLMEIAADVDVVDLSVTAVAMDGPLLPLGRQELERRFPGGVAEAATDADGFIAAWRSPQDETWRWLRAGLQRALVDRAGLRLPRGGYGEIWISTEEGGWKASDLWGEWEGDRGYGVGLAEAPLRFADGTGVRNLELHELLGHFPLYDYRLTQAGQVVQLDVVCAPEIGDAAWEARLLGLLEGRFGQVRMSKLTRLPEGPRLQVVQPRFVPVMALAVKPEKDESLLAAWMSILREWGSATTGALRFAANEALSSVETRVLAAGIQALRALGGEVQPAESCAACTWCIQFVSPGTVTPDDAFTGAARVLHVAYLSETVVKTAILLAAENRQSFNDVADWLGGAAPDERLAEVSLLGLQLDIGTRPVLVAGVVQLPSDPIAVEYSKCSACGDCVEACPVACFQLKDGRLQAQFASCIHCRVCVEACPERALTPRLAADAFLAGPALWRQLNRWQSREAENAESFLSSRLLQAPMSIRKKPLVILGLAMVTTMEHAAALVVDGKLVAAVERERLNRVRHYQWTPTDRPGGSLSSDPTLLLDDAMPQRAVQAVLRQAGLSLDDVDCIALNGLPARFRMSYAKRRRSAAPRLLRCNRLLFVPHHDAHAACAVGLAGYERALVLSVDGRGDRETLAAFVFENGCFERVFDWSDFPDASVGGVYETLTRILGFGSHGQGSTMALAAFGEPSLDLSDCLGFDEVGRPQVSEWRAAERFEHLARVCQTEITPEHHQLAASLQQALEEMLIATARRFRKGYENWPLALTGGVALNCRMNGRLRAALNPPDMFVPPGANDAGTAIGAALIAHRDLTGEWPSNALGHSYLGPDYPDAAIRRWLDGARIPYERLTDIAETTAELLDRGRLVCWFQGGMEFGPRALGARSILADPRRAELKDRLNRMKSRESWRPFGPSILAGRQAEWFVEDWDSRFMLFAVTLRAEKRAIVPVIAHADGSTRPQVVHAEHAPRYHALIDAFERRSGVPMIVNTSFNRGGEPIVMTPAQALASFIQLKADALVLGDALVTLKGLGKRG